MTDARLRELERHFKESGSAEDEAAWLRERLRTGDLDPQRLELAARIGHRAAKRVEPSYEGPPPIPRPLRSKIDFARSWAEPLEEAAVEVRRRATLATARASLQQLVAFNPADPRPSRAFEAAERALLCPCPEHHAAVLAASQDHMERPSSHPDAPSVTAKRARQLYSAWRDVLCAGFFVIGNSDGPHVVSSSVLFCQQGLGGGREGMQRALDAVVDELIPWLLGYRDPVAERVGLGL